MSGAALEVVSVGDRYGRFVGAPAPSELERFFFLDDADRRLVCQRRGDRNRIGFAVQLGTVRFLGTFLSDPTDVPTAVVDFVAAQLEVDDPSCLKGYLARRSTRFEHATEITEVYGFSDFAAAEAKLAAWIADRAWTTGEGPSALFDGAAGWLRERRVLLPGRSRLERLVGHVRDTTTQRLYDVLAALPTPVQTQGLMALLDVPAGARVSDLERLRSGPTARSGRALVAAFERVEELAALGVGSVDLDTVPARRVVELARWGMTAKASALRRHPPARQVATVLATVVYLEARATDDALELFDTLMTNELIARAKREATAATVRQFPGVVRDAATCAAAVAVLLASTTGDDELTVAMLWAAIEQVVSRAELAVAVAHLAEVAPPPDATPGGEWRAGLLERYRVVRPFLPQLGQVIEFGATTDAAPVLDALRQLPELVAARHTRRVPAKYLDATQVAVDVVPAGWWQPLVFPPDRPEGTVDRAAYVFCVLEQFHRHLINRDIHAAASSRWADPRAKLLTGPAWDAARGPALNALGLPTDPDLVLGAAAQALDAAWRTAAAGLDDAVDADASSTGTGGSMPPRSTRYPTLRA